MHLLLGVAMFAAIGLILLAFAPPKVPAHVS